MASFNTLKVFFKELNSCTTIDGIESLLQVLSGKRLKLRIFDENISDSESNVKYLNELNSDIKMFDKFINGEPLIIKDKAVYPILQKGQLIGSIEASVSGKDEIENLGIAAQVIALKVENLRLVSQITKNSDFHNAMKNIAKIIETQYELSYIIPIIGEILDTFVENHLIYIYIRDGEETKLAWPSSCLDNNIKNLVSKKLDENVVFSSNKKIGIFPLVSENNILGCVVTKSTLDELTSQETYYIQQLVKQSATTITRAKVYAEILKYATLDALTGFYNRRQLDERVRQEVSQAKRKNNNLCAIMTDIDYFKKVNDSYGHAAGDLVLKTVANTIRTLLREYDIAARYGGEEFVILLPSTNIQEAQQVAERLRQAVSDVIIDISKVNTKNDETNISVTISVGVASHNNETSPEKLIMNADKALYNAKESGRNKVVIFN